MSTVFKEIEITKESELRDIIRKNPEILEEGLKS